MVSSIVQTRTLISEAEQLLSSNPDESAEKAATAIGNLSTESLSTRESLATACQIAGLANRTLGRLQQAVDHFLKAEKLYELLSDDTNLREVVTQLSFIFTDLGHLERALEYALKRLHMAEKRNDIVTINRVYQHLGVIQMHYGNFDEAQDYFFKSLEISEQIEAELVDSFALYGNLSELYMQTGDYQNALLNAVKALELYNGQDNLKAGMPDVYLNIARIHRKRGKLQEAFSYAQRSFEFATNIHSEYWQAHALLLHGQLYLEQSSPEKSIRTLEDALALAEKHQMLCLRRDIHQSLADAHKITGDFEAALTHYERFHELYTRIFNQESAERYRNLEIIHQTNQAKEELQRQQQLREQDKEQFERLSRIQQHFIHSASHDLKSPLSSVRLNLSLIRRQPDYQPALDKYLDNISAAADKMTNLVLNVLDLAKLDIEHLINLENAAIAAFLKKIYDGYLDAAEAAGVQMQHNFDDIDVEVMIDHNLMAQAFGNLLGNAIKYNQSGGRVNITLTETAEQILIEVSDTGAGISAEDIVHIFEPFYRADATSDREGTGLGLHICQRIINQHNGTITVESQPGKGSIFSVTLPRLV